LEWLQAKEKSNDGKQLKNIEVLISILVNLAYQSKGVELVTAIVKFHYYQN
jgi:hypothetical protein